MSNRDFIPEFITRHRDLVTEEQLKRNIVIVGAGAIGSFTALALAKMGFHNITVYDFDTVEPENIGNQFFSTDSIGKTKVAALIEMVHAFTGIKIKGVERKVEPTDDISCDILISAVDNMKVRSMLADIVAAFWIVDPRMAAEYATMHVCEVQNPKALASYQKSLFSDAEAVQERCTAKTTIYTVLLIAGQVVKAVKDISVGSYTSEGKEFIKSLDWNIGKNAMVAFNQASQKL